MLRSYPDAEPAMVCLAQGIEAATLRVAECGTGVEQALELRCCTCCAAERAADRGLTDLQCAGATCMN